MTLIVGIICKDGIVLAADSQTTKGMAKQPGANKIRVIEFANGKALVAESGSASLSASVIDLFQGKAAGRKIENEMTIAKIAEESVREIRNSLTSLHPNNTSPTDWQNYFGEETNYFELMVAYYFGSKPRLYKLNPLWCIPVPATSYFMTSGIAGDLANYILKEHTEPKMDSEFASVIAIKVVEDAIEYVEGCGSPPRVALIQPPIPMPDFLGSSRSPSEPSEYMPNLLSRMRTYQLSEAITIFPQEKVEEIAKIIASVEQQTKSTQNKKIHKELRAQTLKSFKSIQNMLRAGRGSGHTKPIASALMGEANRYHMPAKGAKKTNE